MLQAKAPANDPACSEARFDSLDHAFGVVREAFAAFSNLSALLRSPKVGGKALDAMVPAMVEGRGTVTEALAFLERHLVADETTRPPAIELFAFAREERERLGRALERASRGLHTARERLALEAEIEAVMPRLRAASFLLRLLLVARAGRPTDVDLREVIEQSFLASQRSSHLVCPAIAATVVLPDTACTLQASPATLMPILTLALSLVHRKAGLFPSLLAERMADGSLRILVSDRPLEGDVYTFYTCDLFGPILSCLETASRLAGIEMRMNDDEREIELRFPSLE